MITNLWNSVADFNLDNSPGDYGFSIRLAKENQWTQAFTDQAILEYKKFMYLAATAESMVSPSEIIDIVWHQHLIFTQSYNDFCTLLGKPIQHIPSTHNKADAEKFRQAKERTTALYTQHFGKPPKNIWAFNDMHGILHLKKAKIPLETFVTFGILIFIVLTIPAYFLLQPAYARTGSSDFIPVFLILAAGIILSLEFFNRYILKELVSEFDRTSFIYHLHPSELIYLKTQKLSGVISASVNELVQNGTLKINSDKTIELARDEKTNHLELSNASHRQIISALQGLGKTLYSKLLTNLLAHPIFSNAARSMDAFIARFHESEKFGYLFYTNFGVLAFLLLFAVTRVVTGIVKDKPVFFIVVLTLILTVVIALFLYRLTEQTALQIIPALYEDTLLTKKQIESNWQWSYFLFGTTTLAAEFIPLVNYVDRNENKNGSGEATFSGACGTSGGDGGGGGGGCGGGCGGCGS
jgi:uncharacterized protein (TIGR04222 family)